MKAGHLAGLADLGLGREDQRPLQDVLEGLVALGAPEGREAVHQLVHQDAEGPPAAPATSTSSPAVLWVGGSVNAAAMAQAPAYPAMTAHPAMTARTPVNCWPTSRKIGQRSRQGATVVQRLAQGQAGGPRLSGAPVDGGPVAGAVDDLGRQVLLRAHEGVGAPLRLGDQHQLLRLRRRALLRFAAVLLLSQAKQSRQQSHGTWGPRMGDEIGKAAQRRSAVRRRQLGTGSGGC